MCSLPIPALGGGEGTNRYMELARPRLSSSEWWVGAAAGCFCSQLGDFLVGKAHSKALVSSHCRHSFPTQRTEHGAFSVWDDAEFRKRGRELGQEMLF